jgi:ribonuclease VapC
MILDSSAVVAILRDEPEAVEMAEAMDRARNYRISAVSYVEAAIVIDSSRDPVSSRRFDDFFREAQVGIESVTPQQARIAREAYRDFGKGRHRAGLNFGDCFAYALAKVTAEPLLCKGDDFCHTDVELVLPLHRRGRLG